MRGKVLFRCFASRLLEHAIEMAKITKTRLESRVEDVLCLEHFLLSVFNSDLGQILRNRFASLPPKVLSKSSVRHIGEFRQIFDPDRIIEVIIQVGKAAGKSAFSVISRGKFREFFMSAS